MERSLTAMENTNSAHERIRARDRALSLLNHVTAGVAVAAIAGVGIFGAVSAITIPGVSASTKATTSTSSAATGASSTTSSSSTSSSSGLASSSGTVSSSSSAPVAVTGAS